MIIPVKPPEPYLSELKKQIRYALWDRSHEILLQFEKGLSNAVQAGVDRAQGNLVMVMDADGSHNPP